MIQSIQFDPIRLPPECEALRAEVREFIREETAGGRLDPRKTILDGGFDRDFSRRVGERGWIGMTWSKEYGGHERSYLERYVVTEEFRAANAPVSAHLIADRQSGPMLLHYGAEHHKRDILPRIARGEVCFSIGMSEADSGSDLFAARCKATPTEGGYLISGSKLWTSNAHRSEYMIGLFRTSAATKENRRFGLTQFLVDMSLPGIEINPIRNMTGSHDFNEVVFDELFLPDDCVLGGVDNAWQQAVSELAYERSGPERFLSTYYLIPELMKIMGPDPQNREAEGIGRLVAQLHTLRRMSVSVNGMLAADKSPVLEGSLMKDMGTLWEQNIPEVVRNMADQINVDDAQWGAFEDLLSYTLKSARRQTIMGGTTEVLRGIIARGLGLR